MSNLRLFDSILFILCLIKTHSVGNGLGIAGQKSKSTVSCQENIQQINIDVQVDGIKISDSFNWDLSNPDNAPEEFAVELVADHMLQSGQIITSFRQRTLLE